MPASRKKSEKPSTLWFQIKDMFQLIGTPQGDSPIKETLTKVYVIDAKGGILLRMPAIFTAVRRC